MFTWEQSFRLSSQKGVKANLAHKAKYFRLFRSHNLWLSLLSLSCLLRWNDIAWILKAIQSWFEGSSEKLANIWAFNEISVEGSCRLIFLLHDREIASLCRGISNGREPPTPFRGARLSIASWYFAVSCQSNKILFIFLSQSLETADQRRNNYSSLLTILPLFHYRCCCVVKLLFARIDTNSFAPLTKCLYLLMKTQFFL